MNKDSRYSYEISRYDGGLYTSAYTKVVLYFKGVKVRHWTYSTLFFFNRRIKKLDKVIKK